LKLLQRLADRHLANPVAAHRFDIVYNLPQRGEPVTFARRQPETISKFPANHSGPAMVLRACEPVKIKLLFSNHCLVFVNRHVLGTTLGRGQWGFANLREGENLIELIMLPSARDEYRFGLPRIVWASRPTAIAVL
jgi:hypothetical protein